MLYCDIMVVTSAKPKQTTESQTLTHTEQSSKNARSLLRKERNGRKIILMPLSAERSSQNSARSHGPPPMYPLI